MPDKYNPEVGEIWWSNTCKKHWFFMKKEAAEGDMKSYKWKYTMLRLEDGKEDTIYHGGMNAHGVGWFKKVSQMLGHYVGDTVIRFDMSAVVHVIGTIIEVPNHPTGLFKVGWSDGSFSLSYDIRDIRRMKYDLEDMMNGTISRATVEK